MQRLAWCLLLSTGLFWLSPAPALKRAAAGDFSFSLQGREAVPVATSRILHVGGAAIEVDFSAGNVDLPQERVVEWVERAATAVSTYYGRFPVSRYRVFVIFVEGRRGVNGGTTWGDVGGFPAVTRIHVGEHTTGDDLENDWMMTHEMVHTAFPGMEDEHHWIEEGIATYVEPIARVQAGFLRPEKIWGDMMRDMAQGNPGILDRGLDRTHTWGRTYWGGAQFCLLADVTIRKETHNRKGLQDALRAIVAAGGTIDKDWPITKALETGDRATGTHVLADLYNQMKDTPKAIDLDALWKELGVARGAEGVRFDDAAPAAAIRLAITRRPQE